MPTWISVPVPDDLVPFVLGAVTDWLRDTGQSTRHPISDFSSQVEEDPATAYAWWRWLRPEERRLLRSLLAKGGPTEAEEVAEALGLTSSSIAGILGPLNRRSERDGFPAPVLSRTATSKDGSGRRVKVLSLADEVKRALDQADTGDEPPLPIPIKRVEPQRINASVARTRSRHPNLPLAEARAESRTEDTPR